MSPLYVAFRSETYLGSFNTKNRCLSEFYLKSKFTDGLSVTSLATECDFPERKQQVLGVECAPLACA